MNYSIACNILELSDKFTEKELKHNYYLKALLYHPDKNKDLDAKMKFQEVLEAYNFLNKYKDIEINLNENNSNENSSTENSYIHILEQFINGILDKNIDINKFLLILNKKYSEI